MVEKEDFCHWSDECYILDMILYKGDLKKYFKNNIRNAESYANNIGWRIFLVHQLNIMLYELFKQNIIHNDLKLNNILVKSDFDFVFGDLAMIYEFNNNDDKCVKLDTVQGTKPYISPEARAAKYCRNSDVFSMGKVFVEIITNDLSFGIINLKISWIK